MGYAYLHFRMGDFNNADGVQASMEVSLPMVHDRKDPTGIFISND